jgi:hypothetical protein
MSKAEFEVVCDLEKNNKVAQCVLMQPFVDKFKCSFVDEKNTFVCDLNIKEYNDKIIDLQRQLMNVNRSASRFSSFMSFFGVHGVMEISSKEDNVNIKSEWKQ